MAGLDLGRVASKASIRPKKEGVAPELLPYPYVVKYLAATDVKAQKRKETISASGITALLVLAECPVLRSNSSARCSTV